MVHLIWPYPDTPIQGIWGNVTATIDWCEENYVVSKYIAEWSNTLSNITYFITALYATYSAYKNNLERRFILIGIGFAIVGFGSWLFHMTLLYHFQLLDELPMIYATTIPTWSMVCEFYECKHMKDRDFKRFSTKIQWYVGSIITLASLVITVVYVIIRNPLIHEFAYAFFTGLVVIFAGLLCHSYVSDPRSKRNLTYCMGLGIVLFATGFVAWQLDVNFCPFWTNIRRSYLQLPLGVFLELHAWWHVFTGLGVYYYVIFLQYLRIITSNSQDRFQFIWRWKIIPEVINKDNAINTPYSLEFLGNYVDPAEFSEETQT
ncbi:hypothetical protein TPHA_0I01790 [Tetrapisispora phaffii CBS 4417]|uniref:Alkaline ceramidase n=1 Tax=Tetrapisispora phaffii (strain ATCC 24235 / CBS 4417 / NBRC 1672 / NRRL Y-8282 / UCD 70-5) TaxID=1071381 RepID=G8BXQ5_TETPH|nr:hypothetical protein TPHA_0I01790 [Tetrapisispora phaffii CBS 4417]CCE64683.1 hypothetical protein TPHA_0I01790 [Tetrapisispora phaffii CBS 4417]